jgi:hypothetical protein
MAHFKYSKETLRSGLTPAEWLPVGAQIGRLTNEWAGRSDLVAFVGQNAGQGVAPALFNPELCEVEVNVGIAFGPVKPETIGDLTTRDAQFEWPKASGAILHEALHARYSRWNLEASSKVMSDIEFKALITLEESRIEALGVKLMPHNREFLRSCALEIVLADVNAESEQSLSHSWEAGRLAALTHARVTAGVLSKSDIQSADDLVRTILADDVMDKLESVWSRFQEHTDHYNAEPLHELAREWVEILKQSAEDRGEPSPEEMQQAGGNLIAQIVEALGEDADAVAISVAMAIGDQQQDEEWKKEASERGKEADQAKAHAKVASDVFANSEQDDSDDDKQEQQEKSTASGPSIRTSSRLVETRNPRATERAAAVKIAQMLERAKYRERSETDVKSVLPPGRLRTRAMVQRAAEKSAGIESKVEPWRRTARKHTENPTLTVGVMVDISGSMSAAMEPMATTAWVMSEAVRRVQGKTAMVYYGSDVFATLKPGQHLADVRVFSARDYTEKFDKAFKALDGGLNLLNGSGARLLVIVSDGCYTPEETKLARKWIAECERAGVGVMWLPFDGGRHVKSITTSKKIQIVTDVDDPAAAALTIGKAAADALTKASAA